jgi:tripartite-type tricarboxylate transporter receptor subunit TctC
MPAGLQDTELARIGQRQIPLDSILWYRLPPTTKELGMSLRSAALTMIVAISAVIPAQSASAQNYPTKPIHLIVPYPAGGGTDFFARLVGQKMSELVGQPIVIENKPGAATNLGADFVAKATPDGYTVLLGDVATYAANPSLYKKLPFDRPLSERAGD